MKILVTGGAGFIGSHVVDALIEKGYDVTVIDNLSTGEKGQVNSKADFYEMDLQDYDGVMAFFSKKHFDAIFHLAAQIDVRKSVTFPIHDAATNILTSLHLLELAKKYGTKNFIFSSTGGALYGDGVAIPTSEEASINPISPYGCSKASVEKYLYYYQNVCGISCTALRYANVYGPRQNPHGEAGVIAIFLNSMLQGKSPKIFGGLQTRDFVYVSDVARANVLALDHSISGNYNIGTGIETSISELFSKLNNIFGNKFTAVYENKRNGEQERSLLSYEKIAKSCKWAPEISLEEGLERTYAWFKAQQH